ncbi:MAG TPA: alpha/beta family hydrolase [Puia sp.]|nr:alpha/beta family hydrolase [Puia sp.]
MKKRSVQLQVSPEIGVVSGEYILPEDCRYLMTLAHGAGAGMQHSFLVELATALAGARIGTLRFNFPFMEGKKGRPDKPAVAHQTVAAAISHAHEAYPSLPLYVAGKSFGGRMSSQYLAAHARPGVKGMVFYGFPLHAPGKPSTDRAAHLKDITVPMLFLQGTRDELAPWDLIYKVCSSLRKTRLVKIEGADHGFRAGKRDVVALLARATAEWLAKF